MPERVVIHLIEVVVEHWRIDTVDEHDATVVAGSAEGVVPFRLDIDEAVEVGLEIVKAGKTVIRLRWRRLPPNIGARPPLLLL